MNKLLAIILLLMTFETVSSQNNLTDIKSEMRDYFESQIPSKEKFIFSKILNNKFIFLGSEYEIIDKKYQYTLCEGIKIRFYEKIGNKWLKLKELNQCNESVIIDIDSLQSTIINNNPFFVIMESIARRGTAYNGLEEYKFIFYNTATSSFDIINYEKWARQEGTFSIENQEISKYKYFVKYINENILNNNIEIYDINAHTNFNLKWELKNNGIYDMSDYDSWNSLNYTEYDEFFFNKNKSSSDQTIENDKYVVSSGFVEPLIAFNKETKKSYVLWLPEGWPNGAGWGFRSFYAKFFFDDNTIVVQNDDNLFFFDILNSKFKITRNN